MKINRTYILQKMRPNEFLIGLQNTVLKNGTNILTKTGLLNGMYGHFNEIK